MLMSIDLFLYINKQEKLWSDTNSWMDLEVLIGCLLSANTFFFYGKQNGTRTSVLGGKHCLNSFIVLFHFHGKF